jgi:hypothetical protein
VFQRPTLFDERLALVAGVSGNHRFRVLMDR